MVSAVKSFLAWLVGIAGALVDPLANDVLIPVFQSLKKRLGRKPAA